MAVVNADVPNSFEIVVGTYEQYLLGYKVEKVLNEYKVERNFATHDHLASVRDVASNKHYLASAGADDSVYIYDMRYRMESGRLMHHNDTINCITFSPNASHVFTCSNDGSIAAIRCGNWQLEKHWKQAHKGSPVNAFAIHPTGKIGLSTGGDGVLRTWNLVKGRPAYATNLVPRLKLNAKNITVLKWSPSGEKYLLASNEVLDVYVVDSAGIQIEARLESKVVCAEFLRDDLIAAGLENGKIIFYDLNESVQTLDLSAHNVRVKSMMHIHDLLVTASSSGEIKLWRFTRDKLHMLHTVSCGARITCLSIVLPCKLLTSVKENKVEEKNTIQKSKKFSLKQEVVIEEEGGWDVTDVENVTKNSPKVSKKKKRRVKAKTSVAEISPKNKGFVSDDTEFGGTSKQKKKLKETNPETNNLLGKKRKKPTVEQCETADLSLKKRKRSKAEDAKPDSVSLKSVNTKLKIANSSDVSPNKQKQRLTDNNKIPQNKKKKKKKKVHKA